MNTQKLFQQKINGLDFTHPVGLAAGFDKNAIIGTDLFNLGFSFVEFGTVTPLPQKGNAKPRIFRLPQQQAIINRMGFNNGGVDNMVKNLNDIQSKKQEKQIIGVNIGKNKTGDIDDYYNCFTQVAPYADYITINISSPNTPGLRDLQKAETIKFLIGKCTNYALKNNITVPIFLKLAPDLDKNQITDLAKASLAVKDEGLCGVILTNTTVTRPSLKTSDHQNLAGGLSGAPLFELSTDILRQFARITQNEIPLIGVGGIMNGKDAYEKIRAGASLLQIYTGFIYGGNYLVRQIIHDMEYHLKQDGYRHISEAIGADL